MRRGGNFHFRIVVPCRLRGRLGQREIKVSLRTSDKMAARMRGRLLSNAIETFFQELPGMSHLSTQDLQERIRVYFQACLNRSLEFSLDLPQDPSVDLNAEVAFLQKKAERLRGQLAQHSFDSRVLDAAQKLVGQTTANTAATTQDELSQACVGVMRAEIENARILAAMLSADYERTQPRDPLFVGMSPNGLPAAPGEDVIAPPEARTLAEVGELYITFHEKHWARKTRGDQQRVVALAEAVIGPGKFMRALDVEDVKAVRDALARVPPNYMKSKANKGISVIEAVKANETGASLSLKTQDKYFAMFKSLLIWARNEGYSVSIPGAGVKVAGVGKTNPADRRKPYSTAQLQMIFGSPLFRGYSNEARTKPGPTVTRDGKFWVPLIALFSGMRMGEIVQLLASDLREENGIWFFDVTKGEDKKLKTTSSQRRVPVHHLLLEGGILDLTKAAKGKARIFPDIEPGADGYYSHNFSKWWGRYSKSIGFAAPKSAFHSFRHNFKDALAAAEVPENIAKSLMGHIDKSVHASYGSGPPLPILRIALDKVTYPVALSGVMG